VILCSLIFPTRGWAEVKSQPFPPKPYRVLLVVEKWSDPGSVLVDHEKDSFQPVAALLKAWSVSFDILRLDQQHLDISYLLDRSGNIRYGAVVWLADLPSYKDQDLAALAVAVHAGTSLVVAKSRFLDPTLEALMGAKYREAYTATDPLRITEPHYITRQLIAEGLNSLKTNWDFATRFWVEPQGAKVLIDQSGHPVLTLCQIADDVSAIWLGVPEISLLRDSPYWREIFFRSLIWSLGYLIQPNVDYSRAIEIEMDDWGTADKGFLSYWHYLEPSEETLREHLITPLKKHHAVAAANVITGYVDRKSRRIVSPWERKFTDPWGLHQDYGSTRRGLLDAVAAGVLQIESHGWDHMDPDLESPPGPWWTEDLKGEASADGWYSEFADHRRGTEIPAIVQIFHLEQGIKDIEKDFGQRPLELRPGNGGWSKSQFNNTGRLAARVGFGIFHAEPDFFYYLDHRLVLDMTGISPHFTTGYDRLSTLQSDLKPPHPDGPVMVVFHDRDISLRPDFVESFLDALPAGHMPISANQYIGILHTQIASSSTDTEWQLIFDYEDPYCAFFGKHASSWRLWLSDPLREKIESLQSVRLRTDKEEAKSIRPEDLSRQPLVIQIPPGLGRHVWELDIVR
jgi:peptidoglycan/xylan/chitin deacetylase (PgdA/CDA1 family)